MTTRILITDDSALARKQLARSLPEHLNADVTFAENGKIAIEALQSQPFDLMFLDLTMPEMDGFQTLEAMRDQNIKVPVFVVSGDIQPKAQQRVLALGAQAFVKKPVSQAELVEMLKPYKDLERVQSAPQPSTPIQAISAPASVKIGRREMYMEVVNVAMGAQPIR